MQGPCLTLDGRAIARRRPKALGNLAFLRAQDRQQAYRTSGSATPLRGRGLAKPSSLRAPTVSDASARTAAAGLNDIWRILVSQGYVLTHEAVIGLHASFREKFREAYFNERTLRHDDGDWPVDRQRARDVIRYKWRGDDLRLKEYKKITITDRAGIPGKRDHSRVKLLRDAQAKDMVRAFLELVPPDLRNSEGTFGVNLFRTFSNVVSKLHRDYEQYVITYVLDREGGGAETHLYEHADVTDDGKPTADAKPVLRHQLNPGEIIIFDDYRFRHGATPLEASPCKTTRRDALVCTVDCRDTYLAARGAGSRAAALAGIRCLVSRWTRRHRHDGRGTGEASEIDGAGAVTRR